MTDINNISKKLSIKIATKSDIALIVDFLISQQQELDDESIERNKLIKIIENGFHRYTWFLFYENNIPFGTVHIEQWWYYLDETPCYLIGGMYIKPDSRGKGYYRKIMEFIQDFAKQHGSNQFLADVDVPNTKSANALKAMEFRELNIRTYAKTF